MALDHWVGCNNGCASFEGDICDICSFGYSSDLERILKLPIWVKCNKAGLMKDQRKIVEICFVSVS